jgi:hypothetical protein
MGMSKKATSLFLALVTGFAALGLAPAYAVDERVIDVVSVTWAGAAAPAGDVNEVARVIDTEVNADWKKFTTLYGDTKDRTISFVSGKVLAEPISLVSKMACSGFAASDFLSSIRLEAYERLGVSDYSKRYLVVIAPAAGCAWSGRAPLGGATSVSGMLVLHDSASSFVITHELGHTFGLGHSNFLRCDNAANDGAWSNSCKAVEYGGTIDVMGNANTSSPLNTFHQWRMGYLDDSQVKQIWQSEIVNLAPSDFANGIRAIYIRDGKAAYWVEYRRKLEGVGYKPGLVIFRLDPPPISSIVSPNPEDASAEEFGAALGTDVWMLNLDNYQYRDSRSVSGSMSALTATTYSGNVSFSAVASETGAVVTIKKKTDNPAPPVPPIVPIEQWRSPGMTIIKSEYEDADTAIAGFEAQIDGAVQSVPASPIDGWVPTYLNPFFTPKTLYLRDLPEGSYNFALRAIDIFGNKSNWSPTIKVVIDRDHPLVTNEFVVNAVSSNEVSLQWAGVTDTGSGICQVNIVDEEGLMIQSSSVKNAPVFKVSTSATLTGTAQVFDCIGNGMRGDLSLKASLVLADKSSKTGKWSPAGATYGAGAIKCIGKCSASLSVSGKNNVLVGTGAATVAIGNKTVATIADSKVAKLRVGASIDTGASKKVVRVSGSNFVLIGLSSFTSTIGSFKEFDRALEIDDPSLSDSKQSVLAKYGFRSSDFGQEWTVLPMQKGTTLEDPSLDLCNGVFASEKDRIERRQVTATKKGSTFVFLSTEVVRYSSAAAASAAQKELVKVLADCKTNKGYSDAAGILVPYEFKTLNNIPSGVVSESNRMFVFTNIGSGTNTRTLLGFYQFNGDIFTGLYVMNAAGFSDAQVAKWLKVAVTMATRLKG